MEFESQRLQLSCKILNNSEGMNWELALGKQGSNQSLYNWKESSCSVILGVFISGVVSTKEWP